MQDRELLHAPADNAEVAANRLIKPPAAAEGLKKPIILGISQSIETSSIVEHSPCKYIMERPSLVQTIPSWITAMLERLQPPARQFQEVSGLSEARENGTLRVLS